MTGSHLKRIFSYALEYTKNALADITAWDNISVLRTIRDRLVWRHFVVWLRHAWRHDASAKAATCSEQNYCWRLAAPEDTCWKFQPISSRRWQNQLATKVWQGVLTLWQPAACTCRLKYDRVWHKPHIVAVYLLQYIVIGGYKKTARKQQIVKNCEIDIAVELQN